MKFTCIMGEGAAVDVVDTGAFPANVETWHSVDGDPSPTEIRMDAPQPDTPLNVAIASPWMGQVIYRDHTTVATVTVSGLLLGENGCEFSGTVTVAPLSS